MKNPRPSNQADMLRAIDRLLNAKGILPLRSGVRSLKKQITSNPPAVPHHDGTNGGSELANISLNRFLAELDQIEQAKTLPRARYYLDRLRRSLVEVNTRSVNDINLNRWKEYENILTDSLWLMERRDVSGGHSAWYWGNFVPQIPQQLMLRYTKAGEWVLDPFAGSGTTLLESRRLGRNCIGIELQASVARKVRQRLKLHDAGDRQTVTGLEVGDSTSLNARKMLKLYGTKSVQLIILHPPYHNIIQFSKNRHDLSNAGSAEEFTAQFGKVVDNVEPVLDPGRMLAVVIGDKYEKGEWIPLGFMAMNEVLKRKFRLKSIVVKNFEETTGKRNQKELWRFRALAGGFYVFKHEYIFIFQKL
jgi:hypothetical protein